MCRHSSGRGSCFTGWFLVILVLPGFAHGDWTCQQLQDCKGGEVWWCSCPSNPPWTCCGGQQMFLPAQTGFPLNSHPSCVHKGYKYIFHSIQIRHALKIFIHCIHSHSPLDSSPDNSKSCHYSIVCRGENSSVEVVYLLENLRKFQLCTDCSSGSWAGPFKEMSSIRRQGLLGFVLLHF